MVSLPAEIADEIATAKRDITHPYVGELMLPRDETLLTRGGGLAGLKIYDDIERDGHVFAVLNKRRSALIAYPWFVEPASDAPADVEAADLVRGQLAALNLDALTMHLLDAVPKGYAVGEIMWERDGAAIVARQVKPRDQRRFRFDRDQRLRLLTPGDTSLGTVMPDRKFIVHSVGSKDGNPYGLGLGTRLFWLAYFKRQDITFWLTFLDKFGTPTTVGKYPPGTDKANQDKLLAGLAALAQDTSVIVPQGMIVELLEADRTGSTDAYEKFCRYLDEQISETVLGETLSTNIDGGGSRAAAETHNGVRLELAQADAGLLAEALNATLVRWIVDLNRPGATPPRLRWEVSAGEDLNARAERDAKIASMGFKPTLKYITDTYGGEWEEVSAAPPAAAEVAQLGAGDAAFAERFIERLAARVSFSERAPDVIDHFAARLAGEAGPAVEAMTARIAHLFAEAPSLEAIRDGLLDLYGDLDPARFGRALELAIQASDLAGRAAVKARA